MTEQRVESPAAGRRGLRGRFRRRTLLLGVLGVAVLVLLLSSVLGSRPSVGTVLPVEVPEAHVGTTYAFDGAVCLDAPFGATVASVEVQQAPGGTTRVGLPPEGARPAVAFPVDPEAAGSEVAGYEVPEGTSDCSLRLTVTPEQQGEVAAGQVRVRYRYGPADLLRRTATVRPAVTLDVSRTGPDPRSSAR